YLSTSDSPLSGHCISLSQFDEDAALHSALGRHSAALPLQRLVSHLTWLSSIYAAAHLFALVSPSFLSASCRSTGAGSTETSTLSLIPTWPESCGNVRC